MSKKNKRDDEAWQVVIERAVAALPLDIDDRIKVLDAIIQVAPEDHRSTRLVTALAEPLLEHRRLQITFRMGGGQ
jgi:hypothetical protein